MPREIQIRCQKSRPGDPLVATVSLEDFTMIPRSEKYTEAGPLDAKGRPTTVEKTRTWEDRRLDANAAHTVECTEPHAHSLQTCVVAKARAASWTCGVNHVHTGDPKLATGCFAKRNLRQYLTEILDARNAAKAQAEVDLSPAGPVVL